MLTLLSKVGFSFVGFTNHFEIVHRHFVFVGGLVKVLRCATVLLKNELSSRRFIFAYFIQLKFDLSYFEVVMWRVTCFLVLLFFPFSLQVTLLFTLELSL